jgi:hypothetical protein
MRAEFDAAAQKIRYVSGPATDASPKLMEALQAASLGGTTPSPIGMEAVKEGTEWKLLLGQRCKGRDGTLIEWPSGRAEMCPTGTQPVSGDGYMSWQCDSMYKKNYRLHCCSVKSSHGQKKIQCVPNLVDQSGSMGCQCSGVNAGGWSDAKEGEEGKDELPEGTESSMAPASLCVALLPSLGASERIRGSCRRGCDRHPGHSFL